MTCTRWLWISTLVLSFACGGDDGDDDTGNDSNGDETPASDDFAPMDADASVSADDGGTTDGGGSTGVDASSGAADSTGGGACIGAGEACTPNDLCNSWLCTCAAGETEFMTVGSCENGTCTTDGNAVCEPICMNSGGVAMAVDGGCG